MKLANEFKTVVTKYEAVKEEIKIYAERLKKEGGYNCFETRLAWDCIRAVMGTNWICEAYEKYNCNDTHIGTLAKKALKEVYKV